ncbi:MAG: GcrA family cell cycle regulator [Micavibrio sp.]
MAGTRFKPLLSSSCFHEIVTAQKDSSIISNLRSAKGEDKTMSWTDERVSLLKQLWGEGKTAAEIAKVLGDGITRNAVIGKAHRLKLSSRLSPIQQNASKKPAKAEAAPPRVFKPTVKMPVFLGHEVKMADLDSRMCRWPNGDPQEENFSFCGCAAIAGLPYCDTHARMAYQVPARARTLQAEDFAADAGTPADFEIKTGTAA